VAGEASCTGVHGANRLASNSLMEVLVFSRRIIDTTLGKTRDPQTRPQREVINGKLPEIESVQTSPCRPSLEDLQKLMWSRAGIIRDGKGLEEAGHMLACWQAWLDGETSETDIELGNLVLLARLLVEAASMRRESRGAHFRTDFSKPDNDWRRHIVFQKD
jgi:L-aspartate oxidase